MNDSLNYFLNLKCNYQGGCLAQSFLLLTEQPLVQFLAYPKKISMLLGFIHSVGERKVDRDLKILIKPI